MNNRNFVFIVLVFTSLLFSSMKGFSNPEKKQLKAVKTTENIRINGVLDEKAWEEAMVANNFVTYSPTIGESSTKRSEVKILYDNNSLYFGATLYDNDSKNIPRGFSARDEITMNADYFHISLNPHSESQNLFEFIVSSANVQVDRKRINEVTDDFQSDDNGSSHSTATSEEGVFDVNWDAVWESEVKITPEGWVVEIKIPYSAIRFSSKDEMTWGINFWRVDTKNKETSTWNLVDRSVHGISNQQGVLTEIKNIKAPLRLELRPYLSTYAEKYSENSSSDYSYNGGLDLKYGINESFTLDMMLIPDFGQTTSDNVQLNLTAHEIQYDEKRQFFTEGTELFNKAGLFYSRRIGDQPSGYNYVGHGLQEGETIIDNPVETSVINATKISGRTNNNLGLGFFNAVTQNMYATIEDSLGNKREVLTEPLANYNILVVDQTFGKYSYVNLINTNKYVWETGAMSNVTGTAFKFTDKNNTYGVYGTAALSMLPDKTTGEYMNLYLGKISGKFQYNYNLELISDKYDPNAMGYFTFKNELNHNVTVKKQSFRPKGMFLTRSTSVQVSYKTLYTPNTFTEAKIFFKTFNVLKNNYIVSADLFWKPFGQKDFYEPRITNRYYQRPASYSGGFFVMSDSRKAFTWNTRFSYKKEQGPEYYFGITPGLRLSNKLSFTYSVDGWKTVGDIGYAGSEHGGAMNPDSIPFGERTVSGISQSLTGAYSFNNKSTLSLKVRHYWSTVDYKKYFILNQDGSLTDYPEYFGPDLNFNAFNIDMIYNWNFAPGSFLTLMWKNNIFNMTPIFTNEFESFPENFSNIFDLPQTNSLSIKITYYLDYISMFRRN
ncbi:MAG: carbohydrate binding family 9 domain-containing protein [Bacteroidales bacterium]|nr:carbohydrate binding family 9 domain-containing protein [Bacteroidales bacterium]